ncbi:MAG TPA: hypothetical protein PKJ77_03820, partial [Thermodesulfobacteriota bacterium]|nr:hypothetical protein [Thermodesulfobacteriota bacterium]
PNIATKYIQTLPHVRYIAAGINFDGHCLFSDSKSASAFISEKFIKAGPWLTTDQNADISITFAYPYNNKKKSISLRPGEISQSNGERLPGILVNANYHFGIAESELNLLESFVASWHDPYRDFEHFTMEVFGEE